MLDKFPKKYLTFLKIADVAVFQKISYPKSIIKYVNEKKEAVVRDFAPNKTEEYSMFKSGRKRSSNLEKVDVARIFSNANLNPTGETNQNDFESPLSRNSPTNLDEEIDEENDLFEKDDYILDSNIRSVMCFPLAYPKSKRRGSKSEVSKSPPKPIEMPSLVEPMPDSSSSPPSPTNSQPLPQKQPALATKSSLPNATKEGKKKLSMKDFLKTEVQFQEFQEKSPSAGAKNEGTSESCYVTPSRKSSIIAEEFLKNMTNQAYFGIIYFENTSILDYRFEDLPKPNLLFLQVLLTLVETHIESTIHYLQLQRHHNCLLIEQEQRELFLTDFTSRICHEIRFFLKISTFFSKNIVNLCQKTQKSIARNSLFSAKFG